MKTPNITQAQILALVTFIAGQLVAWGWLTSSRSQLVVSITSTAIAAAWKLADAWIRHGRSKAAAVQLLEQLVMEKQTSSS